MKAMSRVAFLLVMAALLATIPALTVHAQGDNCFGLSAADCQLVQAAGANSPAKLTSFVMDYALNLKVSGTGTSDGEVKVTGNGPFSIDQSKISGGMTMENADAILPAIMMQNTISATATTGGKTQSDNIEFRIVNGKIYYKDDMQTKGKWMVQSLSSAMKSNSSVGSALSGGSTGAAAQMFSDPKVMAALAKLPYAKGFITAKRGADLDIGGEKSADFAYNIDALSLLKSPELKDAAKTLMEAAGQPTDQLDQMMGQYTGMAQTFLKNLKITVHQYVGTNDKLLHGVGLDVVLNLDAATAGMITNQASAKPIDLNLNFTVKMTKVGEKVTVEPVADAVEATPASSQ